MVVAVEVPEGLAALPPGPGLAAALAGLEPGRLPNDRILEVLRAQYRQLCHEQARMIAVIAEVGRCAGRGDPGGVDRLDEPDEYASEETRAALRWTRHAAESEHLLAETVVHGMPAVFAAWWAGDLDRQRVLVFDRYLLGLTPAQVVRICRVAVPRAPRLTTGQLAALLRRMVIAVDPDAAARWYRIGVRRRGVIAFPDPDGTITIAANGLPADEAEAACVRLQDLAAAAKRAGYPGSIGQIRCDVFLGMLDGRFHHMSVEQVIATLIAEYRPDGPATADPDGTTAGAGSTDLARPAGSRAPSAPGERRRRPTGSDPDSGDPAGADPAGADPAASTAKASDAACADPAHGFDQRVGIEIRVGLATLLGLDEYPGEIPGLGWLPAADTRHRVAAQRGAEWRFAVTDADGHLITDGRTRYRPSSIGSYPVRHDGPRGGIVELHIPLALLTRLTEGQSVGATVGWAAVIADVTGQHDRRESHLADLDSRPRDRHPHSALRRHTEIRDRTCTYPGCRHRAHAGEQDHTRDHAHGGDTTRANLGPTCTHDHHVKHEGGWEVEQPEPGTFIWHSPLGGTYTSRGELLHPPMPDPSPGVPPPDLEPPHIDIDAPILRRRAAGLPRPAPRPPPPPDDLDEEPPF